MYTHTGGRLKSEKYSRDEMTQLYMNKIKVSADRVILVFCVHTRPQEIRLMQIAGFPPSGKIREKYALLESQGISIFFIESQGKSGNFDLA